MYIICYGFVVGSNKRKLDYIMPSPGSNNLQAPAHRQVPIITNMPPRTSEAPITPGIGLGCYQSLPVLNPPCPNAHHDPDGVHVTQTFRSELLDMDEKERKAGLRVEDKKLVIDVNGKYLEMYSVTVQLVAKLHAGLAAIVRPTFIKLSYPFICSLKLLFGAAIQINSTQFVTREITGFSDILALAVVAINFSLSVPPPSTF